MNSKVIVALVAVLILVVVGGGFLLISRSKAPTAVPVVPSTTSESTPTPETTQEESQSPTANETEVTLSETGFSPKTITIKAGDKVIWINNSGKMATVNSNPHPIHTSYKELNLGNFDDGEKLELVFPNAGTYNYHNHLNASQGGTVIVE
ncbi:MAG: hypothetical protein A2186_00695 [Candidatus Levybacteria bacterium RIFOXYA1_FULL_41_10]|nr:MAG: Plastocyanin [Candidatus Levybacteria bacterium GW2011_GWA1_39_34]KKR50709.1 MAG: Plastocyanin [Candidatus Levybacteria bacterium GW2011_GWC1_40_19]KKR72265.1 MAG: Plastocyanin [Candidatus Levybacteria bacterium GW2011_GWC2_40_7]KKR95311.1 MAG: Plastocyanin [Candidatus Levybacteria bacterium GW2011_GWA2_41_15]KKS01076.1 MAG: Plastocyanin [Candidatus Levybacteria bacterium GW2011_GWB1_41_21]OGH21092.1 MAG: hypothetical protein A2695_01345 [Candidatus Levybacteria bacterium RIFCSPHIGHO2_